MLYSIAYRFITVVLLSTTMLSGQNNDIHIMIVTGGHDFDRAEFFGMFDRMEKIGYREISQPEANALIESGNLTEYDLLLFYDMYDSITFAQKQAYIDLIEAGKPMIFLHHSLVSYQDWPEFTEIVGGKYHTLDSTRLSHYKHDESIPVKVEDKQHPITYGMTDFTIEDETYGNCEILPGVTPLLRTDHPLSMPVIGWVNHYRQRPIVYLQGGHGPTAYQDLNFQKILKNAILWSLRQENAN